jgi:hypothetical protein
MSNAQVMKIKYFVLILLLFSARQSWAQHCGWDGAYIIIVDVRDSVTGKIIDGLKITLTDSAGKPYTSDWNLNNYKNYNIYQGTDTLQFGQNHKKPKKGAADMEYPFSFGIDHYMLFVYPNNYPSFNADSTDLIHIVDPTGNYATKSYPFTFNNILSLCTSMSIWRDKGVLEARKVKVELQRINL